MVESQNKASSGVAKTAVALAGTALGLNLLGANTGTGGGILTTLSGAPAAATNGGYATQRDLGYVQQLSSKDAEISKLQGEKYADQQIVASLGPVYTMLNNQSTEICNLKMGLAMETERRECGDRNLRTFVEGNYIPAEKALNSNAIDWHGVKAVLQPVDNCNPCGCGTR